MTAGAVLLSYGQIPAACDQLGNLIRSPAPRHTRARVKVTLKRGLQVLKAQNLGGAASPRRLPSISGERGLLRGVREREGWCPGEGGCSGRVCGLGREQELGELQGGWGSWSGGS